MINSQMESDTIILFALEDGLENGKSMYDIASDLKMSVATLQKRLIEIHENARKTIELKLRNKYLD